jgi:predicted ATPase/class 3 adenylate cyclase
LDESSSVATFLFTDIEGSTRLWEQEPGRMRPAMARHDALAREAVERHGGHVVKKTGDGLHAAFRDPFDAICAAVQLQLSLEELESDAGLALRARCGMHAGPFERRDDDYYGTAVNRAARIMAAAHGGQVLLSQAVADRVQARLPDGLALRDLGTVRLRDLARPERIFQVVHPALRAEFPALRSLAETPNNLPYSLTTFVGRERELAEVRALLPRTRLLTVTGMGGLGKTRLALQLAAEELDAYPDGVWLVELAPLHDARRVAQAAASAMGVLEEPGHPVLEALERHVSDRQLLVILDNCEHLLEPCAALSRDLLSAGAGVRVLATSREPLRVAGETTYPIAGLPVPAARDSARHTVVASSEAARLFVERANAARPDFTLTEQNAPAIAAICQSLDGIPLALELAAARVRSLPVDEIAARMHDRFRLLTGGDPTALPRQRTLRALIDWSYDLLPPAEQALFRQLSVFAGGWTLEAAEAVCATPGDDGDGVLELIGRLIEKSLVVLDDERRRYHLLETVRQYAQERLEESGEAHAARERHLAYYLALVESARPQLMGPEQGPWLARLDDERENVLWAHAWAQQSPEAGEDGLLLVGDMKLYWINRGLLELGHRVIVEALQHAGAQARGDSRLRGLFHAGQLRYWMGRYAEARACLEEGLAIARELGNPRGISSVLQPLGMAAMAQGERAMARRYLEEALVLAQAQGEKRQLAAALTALAQLDRVEGHPENAEPLYREAVRLMRDVGDDESAAIGLLNLAMVSIMQGDGAAARAMVLEALATAGEIQSRPLTQGVLDVCAGLAALRRDWNGAARFYGAAEAQAGKTGLRRDAADEAFLAPRMQLTRAALSADAFGKAQAAGRALAYDQALREAGEWLRLPDAARVPESPRVTSR